MTTIYSEINNDFTIIPNTILQDNRVGALAFKIYCYMCFRIGRNSKWEFYNNEILNHCKEGISSFKVAKKQLVDLGYLKKVQQNHKENGVFSGCDYIIYKNPTLPWVDLPTTVQPTTVQPWSVNQPTNNKDINNKDINNKEARLASKPALNSFERDDPHIEIGAQPKPKPTQQASKQSLSEKQQDILRAYHNSLKATSTLDSERIDEIRHAEEKQQAALTSIENYLIESGETISQLEEIFKNKHAQYANKEQGYAGLRLFTSHDCAILREQKSQKVVKLQKKQEIDKKTADKNAQIKQDISDIKEAFAAKKLARTQDKDNVIEKLKLPSNSYKHIADKILQATIHGVYWWDGKKVLIVQHADVDFLAEYQVYISNAILRANVAIDRIINIVKYD